MFRRRDFLSLHRPGQLNYYFPLFMRRLVQGLERFFLKLRLPGSVLVVRLEK